VFIPRKSVIKEMIIPKLYSFCWALSYILLWKSARGMQTKSRWDFNAILLLLWQIQSEKWGNYLWTTEKGAVFFPRELRKSAREKSLESAREQFCMCPWTFGNKYARKPKKVTVNTKKVPMNFKIGREHFQQKSAREPTKTAHEHLISINFGAFWQKVQVIFEKCPWFKKIMPVNHEKCPWKRPKECPWTQPLTCEFFARSSREPNKVPVKNVRKMRFTGTFDVHGKKKHRKGVKSLAYDT